MTLTNKQKNFLRAEAHHLKPIFQIGKEGRNEQLVRHVNEAIEIRELMKVNVLNNSLEDAKEVGIWLAKETESELVQVIGRTIILYKESRDNKQLTLPR